jgi:hypothetical protein
VRAQIAAPLEPPERVDRSSIRCRIFALGHSTLPVERFVALLQIYGIEQTSWTSVSASVVAMPCASR